MYKTSEAGGIDPASDNKTEGRTKGSWVIFPEEKLFSRSSRKMT